MDDTDGDRAGSNPFGGETTPAIRRIEDASAPDATVPDAETTVPDVESLTGDPQTLEPTIRSVWMIQSAISAAVLGVIAAVVFSVVSPGGPWVGAVVFAGAAALGIVFSLLKYRIWMYQVRDDSLYLKRGVLTRVNTVAPYVRIQHVDTRRGPIERAFGLATTVVYTAGSRGADVSIPGLTPERADDLQTRLKHLAIAAEGEDAV